SLHPRHGSALRPGHTTDNCISGGCKTCNLKHNSLLHIALSPESNSNVTEDTVVSHFCKGQPTTVVLLSTALIKILDANNQAHLCRALLDCGSQSSFITSKLCAKLGLNLKPINISISGINLSSSNVV